MPTNSHLTLIGPRHGELFSDSAAGAIWAALLTLDVALQHEFLARLQERLAVPVLAGGTHKVRIARLVAATREADGMLLAQASADPVFDPTAPPALTEDAYEKLRKRHREFGWPPASTMRSWVQGGWNDVLSRAMVKTVDGGDAVFMVSNTDYSWEEVAAAVCGFRDYLTEQGHPDPTGFGFHDLINWAKLPHVLARAGRRPRSQSPFDNYGGFLAVKAAALAGEPAPNARAGRGRGSGSRGGSGTEAGRGAGEVGGVGGSGSGGPSPRKAVRSGHLRPASGYGYESTELKAALDEVVAYRDGRVPSATEFISARRDIIAMEQRAGLPARGFPSYNRMLGVAKPWDAVLVTFGYPPFREVEVDAQTGRVSVADAPNAIPVADLHAGLLEAFEQRGKPFGRGVYDTYVKDRGRVGPSGKRLPVSPTICARYRDIAGDRGAFKHACDLALPAGWDQPDE